jgi:hypothetical protein
VKTLYVHDGTGKYMSPKELKTVFNALHAARESLGVQQISLAIPDVIGSNSHFLALIQAFNETTEGKTAVGQTFSDADIRDLVVRKGSSSSYDGIDRNQKAIVMEPTAEQLASVQVEVLPAETPIFEGNPLSRKDALTLGFDLERTRPAAANEAFRIAGMDDATLAAFKARLANADRLKLDAYYASLTELFRSFEVDFTPEFRAKRGAMFSQGHLNAPDAVTTQNNEYRRATLQLIMDGLTSQASSAPFMAAINGVKANPRAFRESQRFQNFLARELSPERLIAYSLYYLHTNGFPSEAFAPEQLETLEQVVVSSEPHAVNHHAAMAMKILADNGRTKPEYVDKALELIVTTDQIKVQTGWAILKQAKSLNEAQLAKLKTAATSHSYYGGADFDVVKAALLHKFGAGTATTETELKNALEARTVTEQHREFVKAQLDDLRAQPEDGSRTAFFDQMMAKLQAAAPTAPVKQVFSAQERKSIGKSVMWGLKSARTRDQAKRVKEALRARHTRAVR